MKAIVACGLLAVIVILSGISYQLYRMSLSDIDKQCWGLFTPPDTRQSCELVYYTHKLDETTKAILESH